jgi:hypothetical protein
MSESLAQNEATTERGQTGWLVLARHESVAKIVDALLDFPPHREFNQTELAEIATVSRQSVNAHLDLLLDVDILEPVDGTTPQRYRFVPESPVSEAIIRLDGAMNAAGPDS